MTSMKKPPSVWYYFVSFVARKDGGPPAHGMCSVNTDGEVARFEHIEGLKASIEKLGVSDVVIVNYQLLRAE